MSTAQINTQIEKLTESILASIENNGKTFDFNSNPQNFTDGYLVSQKAPSFIFGIDQLTKKKLFESIKYLYFRANKGHYLGFWIDSGKFYLDLSIHIENKSQAIQFGLSQSQLAIWDCKNQKAINLEKYSF